MLSPRGDYLLLSDFTERVDTDISNDTGLLHVPGPPRSFGLYRDGNRIASLPRPGTLDVGYAPAALDAAPYLLRPHAHVLLAGADGGFRIAEVLALGAAKVDALEPEPVLYRALRHGLGPSPAWPADGRVTLSNAGPIAAADSGTRYDVIDLSGDFLDTAEANVTAFTEQALSRYLHALTPAASFPSRSPSAISRSMRCACWPPRAQALLRDGIGDPAAHVLLYRSAWNARLLLSRTRWTAAQIAALRKFCDDRSFDVSWYPGIDVATSRAGIYNDLPAVSFATGQMAANGPDDSIADEAAAVLAGQPSPSRASASTWLRSRWTGRSSMPCCGSDQLGTILQRLEILPQQEIGALVNLAVLAQAVPVRRAGAAGARRWPAGASAQRAPDGCARLCTFPALGLGFLFIEIALIEKASLWLNDRTSGFALVLTGMLVFSGLGSMVTDRLAGRARAATGAGARWWRWPGALPSSPRCSRRSWPRWTGPGRRAPACCWRCPRTGVARPGPAVPARPDCASATVRGLPWAWGLNGAFSVVATPLANLLARGWGFDAVLLCAGACYLLAWVSFPAVRAEQAPGAAATDRWQLPAALPFRRPSA